MNKAILRVLVSDRNPLFRQGIRALLSGAQDVLLVDEAVDAPETITKVEAHQPDVLLLDINIAGARTFDAARAARRVSPRSRLLFLCASEQNERVRAAIAACAEGYIMKNASVSIILKAIRQAPAGPSDLSLAGFDRLLQDLQALSSKVTERHPDPNTLTQREREVLTLIVQGCTAKEIAEHFRLSPKTVEAHKFNLMRKLDVHNRAELIELALKQRVVPDLRASTVEHARESDRLADVL